MIREVWLWSIRHPVSSSALHSFHLINRWKTMSCDERAKCFLKSVENTYPSIEITDDYKIVGRSPECQLRDEAVSRQHLKVKANFARSRIIFEVLGTNASTLNYKELDRNTEYEAKHGDIIEIVASRHPYRVHFDNADESATEKIGNNQNKEVNERNDDSTVANVSKEDEQSPQTKANGAKKQKRKRDSMKSDDGSSTDHSEEQDNEPLKRRKSRIDLKADKPPFNGVDTWQSYNKGKLIVYTPKDCVARQKIAAYDMDGTLITTKTGKVFPTGVDDWKLAFGPVKSTLKKNLADKYKVVIFTNQAGFSKGKISPSDFRKKIENIVKHIDVPAQVFIATGDSIFRKPLTMMWHALLEHLNDGKNIYKDECFYVGDAAGRPENKALKKKKDHSSVDRLFAMNLSLKFATPEEHFLGNKRAEWKKPDFEPHIFLKHVPKNLLEPESSQLASNTVEVIIMVGGPGSGKSTFCKTHLESAGYEIINRDTLKTWQKCAKRCDECLADGKKVVIDNTNGKEDDRKHYIALATKRNVKCRCFVMSTPFSQAEHNIQFRELLDPSHQKINKIVLNTYKKYYKQPTLNEGFTEIVTVNFIPKFQKDEHKTLYGMYLLGS